MGRKRRGITRPATVSSILKQQISQKRDEGLRREPRILEQRSVLREIRVARPPPYPPETHSLADANENRGEIRMREGKNRGLLAADTCGITVRTPGKKKIPLLRSIENSQHFQRVVLEEKVLWFRVQHAIACDVFLHPTTRKAQNLKNRREGQHDTPWPPSPLPASLPLPQTPTKANRLRDKKVGTP